MIVSVRLFIFFIFYKVSINVLFKSIYEMVFNCSIWRNFGVIIMWVNLCFYRVVYICKKDSIKGINGLLKILDI